MGRPDRDHDRCYDDGRKSWGPHHRLGFVVFVIGSLSWIVVGLSSGQTNLLAINAFLTLVNLVGIWRWLGRQRAYEDGGRSARDASRKSSAPTLFTATGIAGMSVETEDGRTVGKTVEAIIECRTGEVSYVVVASPAAGGIAEQLRAVPREAIVFHCDGLSIDLSNAAFEALAPLKDGDWPDTAVPQVAQAA